MEDYAVDKGRQTITLLEKSASKKVQTNSSKSDSTNHDRFCTWYHAFLERLEHISITVLSRIFECV